MTLYGIMFDTRILVTFVEVCVSYLRLLQALDGDSGTVGVKTVERRLGPRLRSHEAYCRGLHNY